MMSEDVKAKIVLQQGDITQADVDAIVNAANNDLLLGGGVAGAIRRAGGPSIQEECYTIGPIPVGEAVITYAGEMKARYVIHAASMSLGGGTTPEALRDSTRNGLRRAEELRLRAIAFPAIGTGIAGFPMAECADIMLGEALAHLRAGSCLEEIRFVLFDAESLAVFRARFAAIEG